MRGLFPETDLYRALREAERGPSRKTLAPGSTFDPGPAIGGLDCWCGQSQDHDWPMKDQGAPHPRYPS
jgi:hypothetical protein